MNQPNRINVSQGRAEELYRGKAATAISDLMVENATLTAALEQAQEMLTTRDLELRKLRSELEQRQGISAPPPAPPQGSPTV